MKKAKVTGMSNSRHLPYLIRRGRKGISDLGSELISYEVVLTFDFYLYNYNYNSKLRLVFWVGFGFGCWTLV
jgi:hypothetical protein